MNSADDSSNRISVIISTRNRCDSLKKTLESFENMTVPQGYSWECLVVDNNSSDGTRSVVDAFVTSGSLPVRYLFEGNRGKSRAMNAGLSSATGQIIVTTDDDCIPDPSWLEAIVRELSNDRLLSLMGGRVELYNQEDTNITTVQISDPMDFTHPQALCSSPVIIGCNLSFRKVVADTIGGFDPFMGPGAKYDAVAEDIDYVYRAFRAGFKIGYRPDVLVYHNHGRRGDADTGALMRKYLIGRGSMYCKHLLRGDGTIGRIAYWEVRSTLKEMAKRLSKWKEIGREIIVLKYLLLGAYYRCLIEVYFKHRQA